MKTPTLITELLGKLTRNPFAAISKVLSAQAWAKLFRFSKARDEQAGLTLTRFELTEEDVRGLDSIESSSWSGLSLPRSVAPVVSIVIPTYGKRDLTLACLRSIQAHTAGIDYEVLWTDDCSPELPPVGLEVKTGVRVLCPEQNGGFLLNCNGAARHARGRILVFLNNDVWVQPGWLEPLVRDLDEDSTIGLVGSRLVNADGSLQEAGGVVYNDGSALNYGRGQNPTLPAMTYRKDVDYVSGCCLAIRKSHWEALGGFDTRYVPAYYEDTDLAFGVRDRGLRVVYEPESVIVHLEGGTHGTDVSSGLKAYQVRNRELFRQKWATQLEGFHVAPGTDVFRARDRSQKTPIVILADRGVPEFDKDAGSQCVLAYVRGFLAQGARVKFVPGSFDRLEPYATQLERWGVEVLAGPAFRWGWQEWFRHHGSEISLVWCGRPETAEWLFEALKPYSQAPRAFFVHDLHYVRWEREAQLTGSTKAAQLARKSRVLEQRLMKSVDLNLMITGLEATAVQRDFGLGPNRTLVVPGYAQEPAWDQAQISRTGKQLLFVGNFIHVPNVDGVQWFLQECWTGVRGREPQAELLLVGMNLPESLRAQVEATPGVRYLGWQSQDQLDALYHTVRAAILPLRFGAGLKGKAVEALARGVPLVGTSIAWEGIESFDQLYAACDSSEAFTKATLAALSGSIDPALVKRGLELVEAHYSPRAVAAVARQLLEFRR